MLQAEKDPGANGAVAVPGEKKTAWPQEGKISFEDVSLRYRYVSVLWGVAYMD